MAKCYSDDFDVSFKELVLMYIFENDILPIENYNQPDDILDAEEAEDYLSLAEYYLSR